MSEHRTVTLLDLASNEQIEVEAKVRDLPHENLANVEADYAEETTILQAAERALIDYRKDHPGDYLVVGVRRGDS